MQQHNLPMGARLNYRAAKGSQMTMFFQCRMRHGADETIGWIEERGAKVGASVELLTGDGKFWDVTHVYTPGLEASALRDKQARDRNALPSLVGKGAN